MTPNELVLSVWPWVRTLAGRYAAGRGVDADELAQDGAALLLFKAGEYDPAKGTPATWAGGILRWHFRRLTDRAARRRAVPLPVAVQDRAAGPADEAAAAEARRLSAGRVERALSVLTPRQREVITARFGLDGGPPKRLADCIPGASKQAAHSACEDGLQRLWEALLLSA